MNKLLKIILYGLLALAVLVIVLIVFSQTGTFRDWVKEKAIAVANESLNAKITSLHLSGNFISEIVLEDVVVELDEQPFFKANRLSLNYRLSPFALLRNQVTINAIILETPEVFLWKKDSVWNYENLVKADSVDTPEPEQKEAAPVNWQLNLPHIEISNGSLDVETTIAEMTGLPVKTKNLKLNLGFWLDDENIKLALEQFSFKTENPAFTVTTIQADAKYTGKNLTAKDVTLETDSSRISSQFKVTNFDAPILDIFAEGKPISLNEIGKAFPELNLKGNPRFEITANGPLSNLNLKFLLQVEESEITLSGNFDFEKEPYRYELDGAVQKFDISALVNDTTLASNLNMGFNLKGYGTEVGDIYAELVGKVDTSSFMNYELTKADLNCKVAGDTASFSLRAGLNELSAQLSGEVLTKTEQFQTKLDIRSLDLSKLDSSSGLNSDINFSISATGEKFDPEKLKANISLNFLPSTIQDVPINSGQVDLSFDNEIGALRDFKIVSPIVTLTAGGNLSVKHQNKLEFKAECEDFSIISSMFPLDSLSGSGTFSGNLNGMADSLFTNFQINIIDTKFRNYVVKRFIGTGDGVISETKTSLDFNGQFNEIRFGESLIDTSRFEFGYRDSLSTFKVEIDNPDQFNFETAGGILLTGDSTIVEIYSFGFSGLEQKWQKQGDLTQVILYDTKTRVTPFVVSSGEQSMSLNGLIDTEGDNNFNVTLDNLDFARMKSMFPEQNDFQARFNFDLKLTGTFAKPRLEGNVELNKGKYSVFSFEKFKGQYTYKDDSFSYSCFLAKDDVDSLLESSAKIPMSLTFSPFGQKIFLDKPFEFKISTRGLDLSFLQAFMTDIKDFKGKLVADIVLRNTLNNLNGVGPIRLINASFKMPEFGLKYKKINLVVVLNKQEMLIRQFSMMSGPGTLEAVEGKLSLARDQLESFNSRFKAKNFQLINNKTAQVQADGSLVLSGSIQNPVFTGDFTVDQARLFYETIEEGAVTLTSKPFFVISDDSVTFERSGALRFQKTEDVEEYDFFESAFYRNLHGEFSVYFPRNTWIRSSDTSIEIEGDVIVVKDRGPDFVLFGSLSVKRGFYKLFGNRFQITSGEMVFNGDPELNPDISIEAVTVVTSTPQGDEKPEKYEFKVQIGGTLFYPQFTFLLDDEVANHQDITSIFLTGRRYDDLKPGEKSSVAEKTGIDDQAKNLLTGQLLKQLSGQLGQRLSLDVIQIESGGSLTDSKVKVGKYVTPDVFVSVSQDFGVEGNQIIELEYQIPKVFDFLNLLLQASSDRSGDTGLDVIWKIEW